MSWERCAAILVDTDGRFLAQLRDGRKACPNRWLMFRGHSPDHCCIQDTDIIRESGMNCTAELKFGARAKGIALQNEA
jgi:hypothetical protein